MTNLLIAVVADCLSPPHLRRGLHIHVKKLIANILMSTNLAVQIFFFVRSLLNPSLFPSLLIEIWVVNLMKLIFNAS